MNVSGIVLAGGLGRRMGGGNAGSSPGIPALNPVSTSQTGPVAVPGAAGASREAQKSLTARLLDEEKKEIMQAVEKCGGNIAGAARALGINRSTLYYRLRKHGLEHLLPTKVAVGGEETPPAGSGESGPSS